MERLKKVIANQKVILIIFIVLALAATIQSLILGPKVFEGIDGEFTKYNNYEIFKYSYYHLIENKDLYIAHPTEHFDLYKYSPTFSVLFAPMALMPDWLGVTTWNLLNALILLLGIYSLPKLNNLQKGLIAVFCLVELMTSLQNCQSNALITGLVILTFTNLEKKNYFIATLAITLSIFIKPFGIVGFALFLFYPKKLKLALYSLSWLVVLFFLPLLFIDFEQFKFLYQSWGNLISQDHSVSYGLSIMGWLHAWFNLSINKNIVALIGVAIFLIPLIRIRQYQNYLFRVFTLVSVLIWVVIFNHKAESPTFIIAFTGVAIWFVLSKKNSINIVLFLTAIFLTSLSQTDLFPPFVRHEFFHPFVIKVVPCILIWCKLIYDMITMDEDNTIEAEAAISLQS